MAAPAKELLKISELAERAEVPVATVRHYLREGLLPEPVKTSRNMAYYPPEFVERIRTIKRLQEERFMPLRVIKDTLLAERTPEAELLERFDVPARALKRLAEVGVLSPDSDGYSQADVRIVEAIARLQGRGLERDHRVRRARRRAPDGGAGPRRRGRAGADGRALLGHGARPGSRAPGKRHEPIPGPDRRAAREGARGSARAQAQRVGAQPRTSSAAVRRRPTSPPMRIVVTNDSRQASRSWRILSSGPIRDIWSISSNGIAAAASSFLPSR